MTINADSILGINDISIEELYVPQWKVSVYIKTLTAEERGLLEAEVYQFGMNGQTVNANIHTDKLAVLLAFVSVCDADGKRIFTTEAHKNSLAKKSAAALNIIAEKAQALSGLSQSDVNKLTEKLKNE